MAIVTYIPVGLTGNNVYYHYRAQSVFRKGRSQEIQESLTEDCRSRWPRGLRRGFADARLL